MDYCIVIETSLHMTLRKGVHAMSASSLKEKQHKAHAAQRGATSIEYAFIAALIASVIVLSVTLVGEKTKDSFESTASKVSDATQG